MKRVGVREFRDRATKYLAAGEALEIARNGQPIGFYIPVPQSSEEQRREARQRLERAVERVLAETGITEDELAKALDLSRTS